MISFAYFDRADAEVQAESTGKYFRRFAVDFVHVAPKSNDWYQYPDAPALYDVLHEIGSKYSRRLSYGDSMGGYEAIKSATYIAADRVLAIAPQFSIDPIKVPFEARWREEAERTIFIHDTMRFDPAIEYFIASDPFNKNDEQHVALFQSCHPAVKRLPVPFGTHFLSHMFADLGLLDEVLNAFVDGSLNRREFRNSVRQHRADSITYLSSVLANLGRRKAGEGAKSSRLAQAIRERIASLDTKIARNHFIKSRVLIELGDQSAALQAARAAVDANPSNPAFQAHLAQLVEKKLSWH